MSKTSKFRGVSWHSSHKKWQSKIQFNSRKFNIGTYETEVEAAVAYDVMSILLKNYKMTKNLSFSETHLQFAIERFFKNRYKNPAHRFFSFVKSTNELECWEWTGWNSGGKGCGYGLFEYKGADMVATRACYQLFIGDLEDKKVVMHKCDNPKCVNPRHLSLGTQLENMQDMVTKGRHRPGGKSKC